MEVKIDKLDKSFRNTRYKSNNEFTICDEEQFESNMNYTNGSIPFVENGKNGENEENVENTDSKLYKNIDFFTIKNTFKYIFNKFKKGIYVSIRNNELVSFLPFSKHNFTNEWGEYIKFDKEKYNSMTDFLILSSKLSGYNVNKKDINQNTSKWYANNFLLRNEYPLKESDTGVETLRDMMVQLCKYRKVSDIDFFINRRDFPILKKNLTEPYNCIYNNKNLPLLSHSYSNYCPILSMSITNDFADIPIPTFEDWKRVSSQEDGILFEECKNYVYNFNLDFSSKIEKAVFRGSNTGQGTTVDTNKRLYLVNLANSKDGKELIDAGITKWNTRPQKEFGKKYLTFTDTTQLKFGLVEPLTPEQQSNYKYIVNVDGHVSAYRLSLEMSMGSVILLVNSEYKLWFKNMLVDGFHYISVKEDMSDLIDKIKWCKRNEEKCKEIAKNALNFYKTYLSKKYILDYLESTINKLKENMGSYVCPFFNMREKIYTRELEIISKNKEDNDKENTKNLELIRCHSYLSSLDTFKTFLSENFDLSLIETESSTKNVISKKDNSEIFSTNIQNNIEVLVKRTCSKDSNDKIKNLYHSYFIGKFCINPIINELNNFSYTYSISVQEDKEDKEELYHIQEYIQGDSLYKWLENESLNLRDLVTIFIQICFILKKSQELIGFIHYDLYPWNVIVKKLNNKKDFYYSLESGVYKINTNFDIKIIDFERSTAIYEGVKYGVNNLFVDNYIQDVLSLLFSSLYIIINKNNTKNTEITDIFKIMNFITKTDYRKDEFNSIGEIKKFLNLNKKMNEMIYSDKKDMLNKNPLDFVNHIISNQIKNNCNLSYSKVSKNKINEENKENKHELEKSVLYTFMNTENKTNFFKVYFEKNKPIFDKYNNLDFSYSSSFGCLENEENEEKEEETEYKEDEYIFMNELLRLYLSGSSDLDNLTKYVYNADKTCIYDNVKFSKCFSIISKSKNNTDFNYLILTDEKLLNKYVEEIFLKNNDYNTNTFKEISKYYLEEIDKYENVKNVKNRLFLEKIVGIRKILTERVFFS